jgi:hypothetical protein
MAQTFDETEFIDTEFQARRSGAATPPAPAAVSTSTLSSPSLLNRPPTREELEAQVSIAQQRLAELKRAQEELERERAALEEARRRRIEFQTGREEMLQGLTRGVGLLEEAEFAARQEAEQVAKSLAGLRDALGKVQALQEEAWTPENWNTELTKALTTLDNARMELNSARLKWPLLDAKVAPAQPVTSDEPSKPEPSLLQPRSYADLCKLGLAFTWPLVVLGLTVLLVLLLRR